jgi:hypothetical protein
MKKRAYRGVEILVAGLLLTSSACAHRSGSTSDMRRPQDPGGAVQLHVTNHSGGPMEVFATGRGSSYRIGTVHPGLVGHFVVRPGMAVNGPVEFLARSGSGPMIRSGLLLLAPGSMVDFELTTSPATSVATVRQWRNE